MLRDPTNEDVPVASGSRVRRGCCRPITSHWLTDPSALDSQPVAGYTVGIGKLCLGTLDSRPGRS